MSRSEWARLSENKKQEGEKQSSESILNAFSSNLIQYIDAEVRFTSQSGNKPYVQLIGVVTPKEGKSIQVTWWLRCAAQKCKMTNVIISGYSLADLVKSERERRNRNIETGR